MKANLKENTNSLNPYKYHSPDNSGISFHFATSNNFGYSIALHDCSDLFGVPENCNSRLMFLVLTPIKPPTIIPRDNRVRDTVVHFIMDFLAKNKDVIFYVCSNKDQQEKVRSRLFTDWFKKYKSPNIEREMKMVDNSETYFIYHNDNSLADAVLNAIDKYNSAGM